MARPPSIPPVVRLGDVATEVNKLCRHIESLEKETHRLGSRIKAFMPEGKYRWSPKLAALDIREPIEKPETVLKAIFQLLRLADQRLREAEYDIANIRGQLDQISNSSWSVSELRKGLNDKKGPTGNR